MRSYVCLLGLLTGCSLIVDSKIEDHERRADAGGGVDGGRSDGGIRMDGGRTDGFVPVDSGTGTDAGPVDSGGDARVEPDSGPTCEGSCIPDVPSGWSGPIALYTGAPGASVPSCAGTYPTSTGEHFGDLDPGSITCACACDPATGISCTGNVRLCYGSSSSFCLTACLSPVTGPTPAMTCSPVSPSGTMARIIPPSPSAAGSCAPRDARTTVDPTWGVAAKGCGGATTTPDGCGSDEICAPAAGAAFGDLCIVTSGEVACPGTGYTEQHVFYESFTDSRTCSACTCGGASSTCGGRVNFTNDACTILTGSVTGCSTHGGGTRATYTPAPSGTCPPSASTMSGTVTQNGAITYCCLPG